MTFVWKIIIVLIFPICVRIKMAINSLLLFSLSRGAFVSSLNWVMLYGHLIENGRSTAVLLSGPRSAVWLSRVLLWPFSDCAPPHRVRSWDCGTYPPAPVRPFLTKPYVPGTLGFLSQMAEGLLPGPVWVSFLDASPKGSLWLENATAGAAKGQLFVEVWIELWLRAVRLHVCV